jgi:hypothetical protein
MLIPVHYRGKKGKGITIEVVIDTFEDYMHYYENRRRPWR